VSLTDSQHSWLARHHIPYVLLDPVAGAPAQVPTVAAAERAGVTQAVRHLHSMGHHRIALITGVPGSRRSESHVDGFRCALQALGGTAELEYTRHADFDAARATQEMNRLLDLPEPPSAVLVCSSSMAAGVRRALHLRGLSVPDDMSVVAFDDHLALSWVMPELVTVQVSATEMAAEAMRMLIRMIGGEAPTVAHVELPTRLVVPQSHLPQHLQWAPAS
jgi:DNA-binding LacI/PurR family transcriptional regulator